MSDSSQSGAVQITGVAGKAVPVRGDDIDTDRIIPARYLRCVTFEGLGEHAFEDDRRAAAGDHPFDSASFQGAEILVVGRNFGCGSSREHAPQSLMRWGIRGIVGESFAEIFFGNCVALGIPCLTLDTGDLEALQGAVERDPTIDVQLDVAGSRVRADGSTWSAAIPDGVRRAFVDGTWDATGLLRADPHEIDAVAARLSYLRSFEA